MFEFYWSPSVSEGVESQAVTIVDDDTGEVIVEALKLPPGASSGTFKAAPGTNVRCSVKTVRGSQVAVASMTFKVPTDPNPVPPLLPATGLGVRPVGASIQPVPTSF